MVRPTLNVHLGGAANEVVSSGVCRLEGLERFIADQASHYGFVGQDCTQLASAIQASDVLKALDQRSLETVVLNAFDRVSKSHAHAGAIDIARAKRVEISHVLDAAVHVTEQQGKLMSPRPEMMEILKSRVAANDAEAVARASTATPKKWTNALTPERVNGGIWLAGAALSLLGTYSAAKNSLTKDEKGERHFQWSQVGVALIQASLAAGCAYMGVQSIRAGRA